MKTPLQPDLSRRDFVKLSAAGSGAAALAGLSAPRALGANSGSDRIRVGVIGCGGRGTGAAKNCLDAAPGVEIVALGDLFENQVNAAQKRLNLTKVQKFWGFDNYEKVLAADIDMVILAAPPGFRPVHFEAAVNANTASRRIHIFTEKPVAVDPVGCRRFIEAARKSKAMGVAVVAGTQRRHQQSYVDTIKRIHDGEMGDLVGGQCYWNGGGIWFRQKDDPKTPWLANVSDFEWQCWNWYHWDWLCGDHIVEQHIHNIDVMNWAFNGPPVKFTGMGGRQSRGNIPGNIWDHFAVELEYANGSRVTSFCRHAPKTMGRVGERVVGTKGTSDPSRWIKGSKPYEFSGPAVDPMVQEHTDLITSIRANNPINDGIRIAESTLTAIGGRMAAYTGREISWSWLLNGSKLDIFPKNPAPGPGIFGSVPIPGETPLV